MRIITLSFALIGLSLNAVAQDLKIKCGPMLGYAEMKEAVVWVQLKNGTQVYATYDDLSTPEVENFTTATVSTSASVAHTAKLYFKQVEPGKTYRYQLYVDDERQELAVPTQFTTAPLWQYRTDPPAFSMAMGSCVYVNDSAYDRPGKPYGGEYGIFEAIADKSPDAMLWLGDNTYLRAADWWTRTGYLERYTHTRSLPEMQRLLATANNFAIWDDHEFGPNDATGAWVHKDLALETFRLFWANHTYGYRDLPGIMSAFSYRDADFVLMDNRYYRSAEHHHTPEQIFGKVQIERMIDLLKASRAPFKFVVCGGQFLNTAQVYETHANYEEERQYLLKRLNDENLKGVVFLSGDRHHSEAMVHQLPNGNKVYEFTVSPLTSGPNTNVNESNSHRIEGSLIQQRNFALMEISGALRARILKFTFYNAAGELLKSYEIDSADIY